MTKKVALARARRGAAYLDSKLGPSWRRKIKRGRLDLAAGAFRARPVAGLRLGACGCILAQLAPKRDGTGFYDDGADFVGIDGWSKRAVTLGFRTGDPSDEYSDLTEAWLEVLREGAPA